MKGKIFQEMHGSHEKRKIVKITACFCKHTRAFQGFSETLSRRNKKCGICCNNFAL